VPERYEKILLVRSIPLGAGLGLPFSFQVRRYFGGAWYFYHRKILISIKLEAVRGPIAGIAGFYTG
jgi:hypothetical protein